LLTFQVGFPLDAALAADADDALVYVGLREDKPADQVRRER
jgi:hypothetical protein